LSIVSLCSDPYTKVAVKEYKTSLEAGSIGERVQPNWNFLFIAFLFSGGVQVISLLFHRKLREIETEIALRPVRANIGERLRRASLKLGS
jgi:hypothetical protein